jgi:hypothetical protein
MGTERALTIVGLGAEGRRRSLAIVGVALRRPLLHRLQADALPPLLVFLAGTTFATAQ